MSSVLVVDDSPIDRRMVEGVLKKNAYLELAFAHDAVQALAAVEKNPPAVVVTDLIMPGMSGLELVSAMKKRFPLVPVVLMTSQGSEEIAIEALELGAASYVPKRRLADELLDTVQRLLAVSGQRHGGERLLKTLSKNECAFVLENDCSLLPPLVGYLQDSVAAIGLCNESDCIRVGVAIEEALVNGLYHGNLEVGSELRETDNKAYYELIQVRRAEPPYRDRRMEVEARLTREEGVFVVRDAGPGFDPNGLADPTDPANLENICGRGLLLMRAFMDEVVFNDIGNEVTMRKRRASDAKVA